ncbi:MAG: cell division protein ZapA [Eubacteriales bacterium]|nr:cell division protein ZapA [Eubacteriales bacterium]
MKSNKAEIKIIGKTYTITGDGTKAYLEKLAGLVDKKVSALFESDKMMPIEMAAILAAINVADDYYKACSEISEQKKQVSIYSEELTDAKTEINNLKIENEMLKLQIGKLKKS